MLVMNRLSTILALAACAALTLFSCKEGYDPEPPTPQSEDHIRFDQLAVGQKSRYLGLTGKNYHSNSDDFTYTDDTLVLEIVGQDANGFRVRESLHYVGDVFTWLNPDKDSVYHYYIHIQDDTLRFKAVSGNYIPSRMVEYLISKTGLPLSNFTNQPITLTGWKTNLGYCECRRTGYALDYELFGQTYPRLNVLIENTPMQYDGNGATYAYDKSVGIVRMSTYSWWTSEGFGWDLLP